MTYKNHKQFYNDPNLYDEILYEDSNLEPEYYMNKASESGSVLYLGSGSGRILKRLCEVNDNVVGMELSESMCVKSRKICPEAKIYCMDVLKMTLEETFDLVIAPYEFLNHFNKTELDTLFRNVYMHLNKNGLFVSQLKSPYQCIGKKHESELTYVELTPGNILEKNYVTYDELNHRYFDYIERINIETSKYDLITMDWYYYFPDELQTLFENRNFTVATILGEFDGSRFNENSSVLIMEAVKK